MTNTTEAVIAANVSDLDAVAAARALKVPKAQRPALWATRWANSEQLQAEFIELDPYIGFMEAIFDGRCSLPRTRG